MIFAPLIFAFATAGFDRSGLPLPKSSASPKPTASPSARFDQYGLPRPKRGWWLVTVAAPGMHPASRMFCVHRSDDLTNLVKRFLEAEAAEQDSAGGGYDCSVSSTGRGKGSAFCTKTSSEYTAMNVILNLSWQAAIAKNRRSLHVDVAGTIKYGGADPRVPSGTASRTETITGVYQGPCGA